MLVGMIWLMIFFVFNQSAIATTPGLNPVSFIDVFHPIDVTADSDHIFVLYHVCLPPRSYQYNQGMYGTFYCPGFTGIYCNPDNFESEILSIDSTGRESVIAFLPSPFGCHQKDHVAISPGLGGFSKGYLYISQGTWSGVDIWKISYDGKSANLIKTNLPPLGADIDITFDTTGSFGYNMIVTGGNQVWKIDPSGKSLKLADIPTRAHRSGSVGGAAVAPSTFGPYGGYVFVPNQDRGNIFAISPNNTMNKVGSWLGASEILFIPQTMCTFGKYQATFLSSHATDSGGSVVMYQKTSFESLPSGALITNEYNPSIALMTLSGNSTVIKQFQSNISTQFLEGSTFVSC